MDLDTTSPAWTAFQKVSQKFPGWQQVVAKVHRELVRPDHGVSFSKDVQPALGDSAAIAVTGIDSATGKPAWVGYVALSDEGKIESALTSDQGKAAGSYHGYKQFRSTDSSGEWAAVGNDGLLVASDESTLHTAVDTREGDDPSLASDSTFQQAMAALPADSLLKAFADPGKIGRLLSLGNFGQSLGIGGTAGGAATSSLQQLSKALSGIRSASFALWATDGGYRASAQIATVPGSSGSIANAFATTSTLQRYVPAGSLFMVNGGGSTGGYQQMFDQPGTAAQLNEIQKLTGISVAHDILPLLTGELAAYAAPGQPGEPPTVGLLLKPKSATAGQAALHDLFTHIVRLEHGQVHLLTYPHGLGQSMVIAGSPFSIGWKHWNGIFTVGNNPTLPGTDDPLAGSPAWNALLAAAGAPADAHVSLYVQLGQALKLFPIQENENLTHLGGILAWSTVAGNQISANLFVQVK